MEIYFVFFFPPAKKEERNPSHIAAHLQAPRANAPRVIVLKNLPTLKKIKNTHNLGYYHRFY